MRYIKRWVPVLDVDSSEDRPRILRSRRKSQRSSKAMSIKCAALCAFGLVLCVIQVANAESLSVLQAKLNVQKNKVETAKRDLNRYKNNLRFNIENKSFQGKIDGMQAINNAVNPAYDKICADTEAAKKEGRDASGCQESARLSFRSLSTDGFNALDKCQKDAVATVLQLDGPIGNIVQQGDHVLAELNSIFPNCYSGNILQMQNCVAVKLGYSGQVVDTYTSSVSSVKSNGDSVISNEASNANRCYVNPPATVRAGIPSIQTTANNCIKNA